MDDVFVAIANEISALWRMVEAMQEQQRTEHAPVVVSGNAPPDDERVVNMVWIKKTATTATLYVWDGASWVHVD